MRLLIALALIWLAALPGRADELVMVDQPGCYWCETWEKEIGPIYPKTAEGQAAPLRPYMLRSETPDVTFDRRVHFTPTFILIKDGQEQGRIEGYPGEDFFWGLLGEMLSDAQVPLQPAG